MCKTYLCVGQSLQFQGEVPENDSQMKTGQRESFVSNIGQLLSEPVRLTNRRLEGVPEVTHDGLVPLLE